MSILCETKARAGEFTPSIGGQVQMAESLADVAQMLDQDLAETLVVIGPDVPAEDAMTFASELRHRRHAVGVVLARDQVDVTLLTRALQAGVREVVPAGDELALAAACQRSRELSRRLLTNGTEGGPGAGTGKVVAVFAAKGGCGKTTLAVNLGVVLARETGQKVCVVDLDLAFGDVAISVQLDPARTIVDALPMIGHLDATGTASLLTPLHPGLDMLLAPVTPGDAEKIPPSLVGELFGVLREMFGYIVVDTPPALSEHVLTAMDASAHHVLLTTPEVPALKNLRVTLDMLDLLSYPADIRSVVLNRSDSKVGLKLEDVERVVRCLISAHVPSSGAVPASINKGIPITVDSPGHPVSKAITRFVQERLLEPVEPMAHRWLRTGRTGRRS